MDEELQRAAHPIKTNQDLWEFEVKSHDLFWPRYIKTAQIRGQTRFLGSEYDSLGAVDTSDPAVSKRQVLVCHDMMGNYREDRKYGTSTKWDDYRFYHWSGVNYFCYFSHFYVTIPPATWINAAHQHGVSVLGTFLTENRDGAKRLREVLEDSETVDKTVDSLVKMCEHFCFEGYLINIECPVEPEKVQTLLYFVRSLTEKIHRNIHKGVVFWYDATDENGKLDWKNELNEHNRCFFNSCDGILINYNWRDEHLENTKNQCNDNPVKVFMGLDVFGRGQLGEMKTAETMSRVVPYNYSVNIFAPGWTYESNGSEFNIDLNAKQGSDKLNYLFMKRNDKFWSLLWEHMPTIAYKKLPFYTDFCVGSGKFSFFMTIKDDRKFFDLSKQSLQPSVPLYGRARYHFEDAVDGGSCLQILQSRKGFRLFATEFQVEKTLVLGFASKGKTAPPQLDCLLEIEGIDSTGICEIVCGNYPAYKAKKGVIFMPRIRSNNTYKITKFLNELDQSVQLPYTLLNGWIVQYFIVSFDQPVMVRDIGIFWRADEEEMYNDNYLGAIYFHAGHLPVEGIDEIHIQDYLVN
ncbi:unnamed protein product [Hermetia illucens]|uniref:Cytosolic endo-beta-N-acetylglucosaminidase TIM barrel domain-containing protein n=3 Tax=Hermetia illucens TaxID=343691 RepID=A0A7R8YZF3_HERIL|nr:unnamed protein product [Hermetia illucens]